MTAVASGNLGFFVRSLRAIERGTGVLHALHGAVWLGLMPREELAELTALGYATRAAHASERDELFNRSGLNAWERAALADFFGDCRSILVGGAGGGREVIALARANVRADGFECNPLLVDLAARILREQGLDARILRCASDEVPAALGRYEGGWVGFAVYMHLVGRAHRVRFLSEFASHLMPGAPMLVSFATRGESRQDRYAAALTRTIQRLRGVAGEAEPGDSLGDTFVHRFTESEIAAELAGAGFELVCFRPLPFGHAVARFVGNQQGEPRDGR